MDKNAKIGQNKFENRMWDHLS